MGENIRLVFERHFLCNFRSTAIGDVMHLQVLGKSMIILDTVQAAVDLLDKKGSIYSDRPPLPLYELWVITI
jgi:hypothetical protein